MKRKLLIGLGVIILAAVGFYGYNAYQFVSFVNDLGECGMSGGPCFGQNINLKLNNAKVDQYLDCPNGQIGFISIQDTLTPIVFKIDSNSKLLWALKLESDSCSGIPLRQMSGMEILEDDGMKRIYFFNQTYSEPGTIYLTDDYNFKYLCLSPM
jgi:hypothetical protein